MQTRKSVSRILAVVATLVGSLQLSNAQINVGGDNVITGSHASAFSGDGNVVAGDYSAAGGYLNNIDAAADYTFLGGGYDNWIYNYYSVIGGGSQNKIHCAGAFIGGGFGNSLLADALGGTIAGGNSNIVTHARATVGGGSTNIAAGAYSTIPGGRQAKTTKTGQFAYANGNFAAPGDAQMSVYIFRGVTTDNNWTELFLDGASERLTIPNNASFLCEILTVCRGTVTENGMRGNFTHDWFYVENRGGTLFGNYMEHGTSLFRVEKFERPNIGAIAEANSTHDAVTIKVKGESGENVNFVVTVRTVELIKP
jgi:hypothetical protein